MNIAVISDIHLGRGDLADRRRGQDEKLLRFLDYLESRYDRIILLGDIWELLTPKIPKTPSRELKIVRAAHPEIARRFASPPYQYVVGNHDYIVETLEKVPDELIIETKQQTLRFTHGHQFDLWSQQLRYVGELVVWTSGWAARFGTQALTRFFDWLHNLITGTSVGTQLGELEIKLIKQSMERGIQVTVMGHTHLPSINEHEGHVLVNSGHCLGDYLHFVSIDTDHSLIKIFRVNQGQNQPMHEDHFELIDQSLLPKLTN